MGKGKKKKKQFINLFVMVGDKKSAPSMVKRKPLNIVSEMLGGKTTSKPMSELEQEQAIEDQERLAKLRQQKNYLERIENERRKLELEKEEKDREEDQEEKDEKEIVQLEKAQEKEDALQKKGIKKLQGTRESGPRPKF